MTELPKLDLKPLPRLGASERELLDFMRALHDNQRKLMDQFEKLRLAVEANIQRNEAGADFLLMGG